MQKPKMIKSFKKLQGLMENYKQTGILSVSKNGEMYVKETNVTELSDQARKLGFGVKLVGVGGKDEVKIEFRGLIKINSVSPDFTSASDDFIIASDECEMD